MNNSIEQLNNLSNEYWQYTLKSNPEFASLVGDRRYDDQWNDRSIEAIYADLDKQQEFLTRFEEIDTDGLPEQEVLNKQIAVHLLRSKINRARFEWWFMPITQMDGPHLSMPCLVSKLRFENINDYENYLTRLRKIPNVFEQLIKLMRVGIIKNLNLTPARILVEQCVDQVIGFTMGHAINSPFAEPIKIFPNTIEQSEQDRISDEILDVIQNIVKPAYTHFADFIIDEYLDKCRKEPGIWSLSDGEARYKCEIENFTTTNLAPEQIYEMGLVQVSRIESEQLQIAQELGFNNLDEIRKHIRQDKSLCAKNREDILERYKKYMAQMYEKLPQLFNHFPKQKMEIQETERFREKEAPGAEYIEGIPDGSRCGMVKVNTSNPTERLMLDAESTAYHEGVPGHHFQIAIQQEIEGLPSFRKHIEYVAFQEGWALYSESLGREVGFYQDKWSLYGHLEDEMLRAIRLVVDVGLHYKKCSREEVINFFYQHCSFDDMTIQSETDRYMAWPGQALSYKIGQLTIERLRDEVKNKLGSEFDIKEFHDRLLEAGSMPLELLELRIRNVYKF
jgi:uncharacterized protein (DUF885 family)